MSYTHLTPNERYVISHLNVAEFSLREIARRLNRHHSTISREIKRNGGYACYRASSAEEATWRRGLRPKACKLAGRPYLVQEITEKWGETDRQLVDYKVFSTEEADAVARTKINEYARTFIRADVELEGMYLQRDLQ